MWAKYTHWGKTLVTHTHTLAEWHFSFCPFQPFRSSPPISTSQPEQQIVACKSDTNNERKKEQSSFLISKFLLLLSNCVCCLVSQLNVNRTHLGLWTSLDRQIVCVHLFDAGQFGYYKTKKWFSKSGSTVLKSWKASATVAKVYPTTVGKQSLLLTANCRAGRAQTAELSWTFTPLTLLASSANSTAEQKSCHSNSTLIFQSSLFENSRILFSLSLCSFYCSRWELNPFLFASLQISDLICRLINRYCFDRST